MNPNTDPISNDIANQQPAAEPPTDGCDCVSKHTSSPGPFGGGEAQSGAFTEASERRSVAEWEAEVQRLECNLAQHDFAYSELLRRYRSTLGLLKSVHDWFMKTAPQHYNGCGLWIDVDSELWEAGVGAVEDTPATEPSAQGDSPAPNEPSSATPGTSVANTTGKPPVEGLPDAK